LVVAEEKKWNEELIKSQQWANKFYAVLYKGSFSHIMSKTPKTLGTTHQPPSNERQFNQ